MRKGLLLGAVLVLMSGRVWAEESAEITSVATGTCGDTCAWELFSDGVLKVSGTGEKGAGEIEGVEWSCDGGCHNTSTWGEYTSQIEKVVIDEGISSVGFSSFRYMSFTDVTLPTTLTSIGTSAFDTGSLKSLTIPEGVTEIGKGAFNNNYITDVEIPLNLTSLVYHVFSSNPIKTLFIPDNVTDIDKYAFYCDGCSSTRNGRAMPLEAIYCTEAQMEQCTVAASYLNAEPTMYSKDSNGNLYVYDGKGNVVGKYASVADLKSDKATERYKYDSAGHLVGIFDGNGQRTWGKKIYTVEEAMEATKNGDKFHVFLTYK